MHFFNNSLRESFSITAYFLAILFSDEPSFLNRENKMAQ